jgi:methionine sulfoxide reductase heme-binding subunit
MKRIARHQGWVILLALLPLWLLPLQGLGANPVEGLLHFSGKSALWLLWITLAISPIIRFTGAISLYPWRRTLGLAAFGWATSHLLVYLLLDQGLNGSEIIGQLDQPRILVGWLALLLLLPLAITSTRAMRQRLGKYWQRLHWLIYPAAILSALHYLLVPKLPWGEPVLMAILLLILLLPRLLPDKRQF